MILILKKKEVVLILNRFNIVFNGEKFGTKKSGLRIEVVLILRWSLSEVPLYLYEFHPYSHSDYRRKDWSCIFKILCSQVTILEQ